MKKPTIIKHTSIFQMMIDKYRNNSSKILQKKKLTQSLDYCLLKDLDQVKNKENFSDKDYLINEIKFENNLKSKKAQNLSNDKEDHKISSFKNNTDKITKDIFFYYKYQLTGRNEKMKDKKYNEMNSNIRIKSPKSVQTINSISVSRSNRSGRKSSARNIVLPLINKNICKYTPSKHYSKTIVGEEEEFDKNYQRIKYSGKNKRQNYLNYKQNSFNNLNVQILLKKIKHYPKNMLWKIKLPLISNKIFNRIEEVSDISKNLSRNINCFYSQGKETIENEKNRIKFMGNLMI